LYEPNPAYLYNYHEIGNSSFESETLLAYELGYRAQMTPALSGSVSAFYNYYDDLRSKSAVIVDTPTSLFNVYFQNALSATTYGFESSVDYQLLSGWRLHAGYDLLKEHLRIGFGGDLADGLGETADPQQQVFLRSSMDLPGRTELDAGARWIDTVYNNNGTSVGDVPSYFEMDARLAWQVTRHLELSIVGQNLLHEYHAEAGYPGATQEEIARSVYGKVVWQF
jgi:iron complex outermembrane receptor protein